MALTRSEWPAVYGSRASSASASALMAPTYACRVSASASLTDFIIVLKAAVSVSTSSEKPVSATGWSKSRDVVISERERDSLSIGLEIVRASQKLANVARAKAPSAMTSTEVKAFCIGTRVAASMESSA